MSKLIPLVSQLCVSEQQTWCEALNKSLQHHQVDARVCLPNELSNHQNALVEFAVVANPEPALLAKYPNIIWVHSLWAGVDRLVNDLKHKPIQLVRLVDPRLALTMAQACVAWSYFVLRDMLRYSQQQQTKTWQQHPVTLAQECNITVLGLGELGQAACAALRHNGFNVRGWSRSNKSIKDVACFAGDEGLTQAVSDADIVICLLPLTDETRQFFDKSRLMQLKQGATLINFARGAIIQEQALLEVLDKEHLSQAILDVFNQEPLPQEHAFWSHNKITVLPHISAPTSQSSACDVVVSNIVNYYNTGQLPQTVSYQKGY
ncbi:glyoxylate/hydroxypyruvate reductase A [Thalassotalea sp. 1_MG-2023]|uniref:2-hydroxyacid dehydrogenase n=1 Tax=Thalassotalea sp. 1_MG-2023 TaxID=3062680 RepID=UPI0026E2BA75|nr:glyoxylate/hydroxypyruvate reductase A [Thalassotalea sp. 1_MG-2023]MDO6428763.1 glyoxylate/hydroxypyruvate reductase A [Thalassotalea sp. 1_MG-2023]